MAFGVDADTQQRWLDRNRPVVQERLSEPVLGFSVCYTTGSWGSLAAGPFSPLVALVTGLIGKKKAGGLPKNFLVAVTATKIHIFAHRLRGTSGLTVKDELAVWNRSQIDLTIDDTAMTKRITIESPSEGERVVFDVTKGRISDEFLSVLQNPSAAS